ncbi:hypothetical protein ElyMa_007018400 [Elysia marginata]|uniref:Uncharacterized protein n=1 Tax=Elysia marginata TaxID=1093978 RepID=A0AAV4JQU4_9GAST|nr:hypothetical protein ElyMa_007018400 [Elysia marginata]
MIILWLSASVYKPASLTFLCPDARKSSDVASVQNLIGPMLLIHKVQVKVVTIGTDLVTDAALPRTHLAMQRLVQEVQASLLKADSAVLATVQVTLRLVVDEKIL